MLDFTNHSFKFDYGNSDWDYENHQINIGGFLIPLELGYFPKHVWHSESELLVVFDNEYNFFDIKLLEQRFKDFILKFREFLNISQYQENNTSYYSCTTKGTFNFSERLREYAFSTHRIQNTFLNESEIGSYIHINPFLVLKISKKGTLLHFETEQTIRKPWLTEIISKNKIFLQTESFYVVGDSINLHFIPKDMTQILSFAEGNNLKSSFCLSEDESYLLIGNIGIRVYKLHSSIHKNDISELSLFKGEYIKSIEKTNQPNAYKVIIQEEDLTTLFFDITENKIISMK